ncbi:hypothetical protein [Methanobrevibacter sp.]|uniref:hypothetical protein n=1 Tax=Methanobrevibacter sp. TaxID=66852 RepID=UPI002E788DE9|nr:hypothetical protein [Methanobrevibacter sp.]MEE0025253.1 hypothetical protein [Methanobrevibacter sp.]
MKCAECKKELNNELIAFCEKCEKYYCISCSSNHGHKLSFCDYTNNKLTTIPIGITAAGINYTHRQFYFEKEIILNKMGCEHIIDKLDNGLPIFEGEDNLFYCSNCFYNSKLKYIRPVMKSNDGQIFSIIPNKIPPFNLDFKFNCEKLGTKGQTIKSRILIRNNKENPITDVEMIIESFAADPLPADIPYPHYYDKIYPYCIFKKRIKQNIIESKEIFNIEVKLDIPLDGEIKKNQFLQFYDENKDNKFLNEELLNIPEKLMIYAQFSYKTCPGNKFFSYLETDIVNIKNI